MIPIPAFNILAANLALGFDLVTQIFLIIVLTLMDPLFKTLYTASMSVQAFLLISAVCPVYFSDLLLSPPTLLLFSGSAVIVYGTSITTNASGTQNPNWECFIDNTSIGWSLSSNSTMGGSQNNWPLCIGGFQDGPHSLTVNANVSNQETFWFDQLQYAPSASVSLNQSLLRIDSNDPAIQYNPASGWLQETIFSGFQGNDLNISSTQVDGATLKYQFSGS